MVEILLWSWDWNLKGLRLISNLTRDRVNRDSSRLFTNILKRKIDDMCKVETTMHGQPGWLKVASDMWIFCMGAGEVKE